ncbi:MAG: glycerol kinase GlpK [Dehalococcoidia bacterium]
MPRILSIDQGTTSSRAIVVDERGAILGMGQQPFRQQFPQPGWVEHDPEEIWSSTETAIAGALGQAGVAPRELAAVGITNQRETVVVWERSSGKAVHNAIVWQDRRTADHCEALRGAGHEEMVRGLTGLTLDPYFSGTKLSWLLRQDSELRRRARAGELAAGTVDSWLLWKLTGGRAHLTDFTNASRTLLFDIRQRRWDEGLCDLFEVPRGMLAEAQPSGTPFGRTATEVIGAELPIHAIAGDQAAALFGQACFSPGDAKNTYGTGCFLLANAGTDMKLSQHRLLTSCAATVADEPVEYALEGSVFVAGSLVQWLRDELGIIQRSDEIEGLAASVPDSGGVTIVPAFTGLGAPYWDPHARGAILGLTRGTSRAHIARAALEAIALSSAELIEAMAGDLGAPLTELRADGGASANDLLMQMQADFSGIPVSRPANTETTAMGAAYLAGLGAGVWDSREEVAALVAPDRRFLPATAGEERARRLASWRTEVGRVLEGRGGR